MFKIEQCRQRDITLHRLTSFDLLQYTFERHIRPLVSESDWRRIDPPLDLYRQVEPLTGQRVVKRRAYSRYS